MKIIEDASEVGEIHYHPNLFIFSEKFETYFQRDVGMSEEGFLAFQKKLPRELTLLNFITIKLEHRRKGYAKKEMMRIMNESSSGVILVCEMHDPFLYEWYESLGFITLETVKGLPVMLFLK